MLANIVNVQVLVYSDSGMEVPVADGEVDTIGFFDLQPLPIRTEVFVCIIITNFVVDHA